MPKGTKKHTHKYGKVKPRKENPDWVIYKCHLPGCTHYLHGETFVLGKQSICWLCGEEFTMSQRSLKVKPECNRCLGFEVEKEKVDVDAIVAEVLKKVGS